MTGHILEPLCKLRFREGSPDAQAMLCAVIYNQPLTDPPPFISSHKPQDIQPQIHSRLLHSTAFHPSLPNPTPSCYLASIMGFHLDFNFDHLYIFLCINFQ